MFHRTGGSANSVFMGKSQKPKAKRGLTSVDEQSSVYIYILGAFCTVTV